MFDMLLYNKKGTAFPCFMEKTVPYKKEKHLTKYQVLSLACVIGGGDKRDRTADLLNAIQALSQLSYTPIFCFRSPPLPDDFCIIAHNRKMSSSFFDFFHFLFSGKNRPGKGKLGLPFSALCVYNERQQKYIK